MLLGDLIGVPVAVTVFGLVITIIMLARHWRAAILLGIVFSTIFATILNYAYDKKSFLSNGVDQGIAELTENTDCSRLQHCWPFNFGVVRQARHRRHHPLGLQPMLSDFFDTMGTLIGVGGQAGYLDKNGDLPQVVKPLLVDSIAAIAGGVVLSSSATTYIESGSGVGVGGRTGWLGVIIAALFPVAMFFSPIAGDGAGQRHGTGTDHRRLPHDAHPHRGRGHGRTRRQRPHARPSPASTSPTSPSGCRRS